METPARETSLSRGRMNQGKSFPLAHPSPGPSHPIRPFRQSALSRHPEIAPLAPTPFIICPVFPHALSSSDPTHTSLPDRPSQSRSRLYSQASLSPCTLPTACAHSCPTYLLRNPVSLPYGRVTPASAKLLPSPPVMRHPILIRSSNPCSLARSSRTKHRSKKAPWTTVALQTTARVTSERSPPLAASPRLRRLARLPPLSSCLGSATR